MKAFILAAGLGTRLKPWTLTHPKALVPVGGSPMLERVLRRLEESGFGEVTVNVHHFGEQIIEYLDKRDGKAIIKISDEREKLLNTGGGLLHARSLLTIPSGPVLIHNVDILSDADLHGLMRNHISSGADITLLTSDRESSRRLVFDAESRLRGWHNLNSGEMKPAGFVGGENYREVAFSGIYVVSENIFLELEKYKRETGIDDFPIMDFLLTKCGELNIRNHHHSELRLIDIGKPDTLSAAQHWQI